MTTASRQLNVRALLLFYGLACALAWTAYYATPAPVGRVQTLLLWGVIMWGPAAAAIICQRCFGIAPSYSLLGPQNKARYTAFYVLPMLILAIIAWALDDTQVLNDLRGGIAVTGFMLTLGEELGWRGFLQPLLAPRIAAPWRWLATGILWELWHVPFRLDGGALPHAVQALVTVALAVILGWAVERSRALIVPVTLHLWANALLEMSTITCYAAFALSVPLWAAMLTVNTFVLPQRARRP